MAERNYFQFVSVFALTALAVFASDDGKLGGAAGSADHSSPEKTGVAAQRPAVPPVLRRIEPDDSLFVLLPGPAPAKASVVPPAAAVYTVAPVHPPAPASTAKVVELAERHSAPPPELADPGRPILKRSPRPVYPEDFESDSGIFCQKQIGQWKEDAAMAMLGVPSGNRPAFDDDQKVNGRIYAFSDPTNRYKQLELDFDSETGALRTVFVYPWKLTWLDCRRMWGGNVSAAEANRGRKFYSYVNRRLDVLVDATGKVISIGLY